MERENRGGGLTGPSELVLCYPDCRLKVAVGFFRFGCKFEQTNRTSTTMEMLVHPILGTGERCAVQKTSGCPLLS
jgi:hypothetical protein